MTLEDLARLVEAGTPGPFRADGTEVYDSRGFGFTAGRKDAPWIAAVRNHLPRLVQEMRGKPKPLKTLEKGFGPCANEDERYETMAAVEPAKPKAARVRPPLKPLDITDDRTLEEKKADGDHPNPYEALKPKTEADFIKPELTEEDLRFVESVKTNTAQIERATAIPPKALKSPSKKAVECPWFGCDGMVPPGADKCPKCGKGVQ